MKLFMFAASLSKESVNKKLINLTQKLVAKTKVTTDLADFNEFESPLYNADMQNNTGFPKTVTHFIERMHQANGMIISVPEYNFSIPGTLKNLIDWVSRINPIPWKKQRILLLSASPSLVGGNRGLWSTRIPFEACGSLVFPDMFSLSAAHKAFDQDGNLLDANLQQRLVSILNEFIEMIEKLG